MNNDSPNLLLALIALMGTMVGAILAPLIKIKTNIKNDVKNELMNEFKVLILEAMKEADVALNAELKAIREEQRKQGESITAIKTLIHKGKRE